MKPEELAEVLSRMYFEAPKNESSTMIHIFGIKYSAEIRSCGSSPASIVKMAKIPVTYGSEINKAIKIAKYVDLKDSIHF